MASIAACVVTFNRLELLKKVVQGLREQIRKPDEIIVVNNNSSDGTAEWLGRQSDITVLNQANLGSSGGQYALSRYAYDRGFDWIWLMDDDVVCDSDCLAKLCEYSEDASILVPLRHHGDEVYFNDITELNLTNPLKSIWKRILCQDDLHEKTVLVEGFTFEGPLIRRDVFEKIGFPERDFFIYADDTEFSVRAKLAGLVARIVPEAKMRRMIVPLPDKNKFTWKTYYSLRNLIAIDTLNLSFPIRYIRPLGYLLSWLKVASNWKELSTLLKAFIDGLAYKRYEENKNQTNSF